MIFSATNRTEADKIWVVGKNVSGASVSAGQAVEIDVASVTDGHAFTAAKSGSLPSLFLGIADRSAADAEDGVLVQTYGFRAALVSQGTAAIPAGAALKAASGYLLSAYSAGIALGHNFVTLLDTTSAKSAGTVESFSVFIRAM